MVDEQKVREALRYVFDPELQMDVVSLGLIYKIKIEKGAVLVTMTLTSPMCPYGPELLAEVDAKAKALEGVKEVKIDLTFEPKWEPPEEVRMMLGI